MQKFLDRLPPWTHPYLYSFLAPLLALLLVALWEQSDYAILAEDLTESFRYQARAPFDSPADPRLIFVQIDQHTLNKFGTWPWPRNIIADFLKVISAAGTNPRVVTFDILFSQNYDPFRQVQTIDGLSFDEDLAQAIANLPCVITAALSSTDTSKADAQKNKAALKAALADDKNFTIPYLNVTGSVADLPSSDYAEIPIQPLRQASYFGFVDANPDVSGLRSKLPMLLRIQGKIYPALALQTLCQLLGVDANGVKIILGKNIVLKNISGKIWTIPIDAHGFYTLNYRHKESFKSISFYQLFSYLFAAQTTHQLPPEVDINKKVLLIGQSASALTDLGPSPYEGLSPLPLLHLQVLNNVLQKDYRFDVPAGWLVLGWLLVTWALLFYLRKASLVLCIVVPVLMTLLYTTAAFGLFGLWSVQLALFWPVVSFTGVNFGAVVLRWSEEVKGRKEMRQLFSSVTSPRVLHLLEEHPEAFFSHRKVTATMMFSDVAGFTSVSEKLDPPYLASLMNRYLSPMSEIIIRHDGYVNLYMGDGIMALWSALLPDPDHEYKACLAALEQGRVARELTETLPDGRSWNFNIRIGINTGLVSAGNLGSNQKKQYTVMGDEVNLTARLEPTNKDYGTQIIIGPRTYAAVRTRLWTRALDKIIVTGRSEGVLIYELIGQMEDESLNPGSWPAAYEAGLQALWQRQWDEADALFAQCDQLRDGGDVAARLQRRRIQDYRVNPPPDGWQGDYARLKKD